jgi:hypothetical protein
MSWRTRQQQTPPKTSDTVLCFDLSGWRIGRSFRRDRGSLPLQGILGVSHWARCLRIDDFAGMVRTKSLASRPIAAVLDLDSCRHWPGCSLHLLCLLADFSIDQRQERSHSCGSIHPHPTDRFDRNRQPRTKSAGILHCGDSVLCPSICVDLLVWELEFSRTCRNRNQDGSGPDSSGFDPRRAGSVRAHSHSRRQNTSLLDTGRTLRRCRRSHLHGTETRMAGKLADLFAGLYGRRSSIDGMVFNWHSRP